MKQVISIVVCMLLLSIPSCKKNEEPIVEFETTAGTIQVKLFKETPLHRDNFVKLVEDGYYDGMIFHRAIKNFLIQTGDPNSKEANHNRLLGSGGPDYTIKAEIHPQLFHKRGMLSAARLPDTENPDKKSNGSQFCIIQGQVYTSADLDTLELDAYNRQLNLVWQRIVAKNRNKISAISLSGDSLLLQAFQDSLVNQAEKDMKNEQVFLFTPEQRKAYTTVGGAPFMDNEYTIFGEVIEGLDVVEKISLLPVDMNTRPLKDVRIISAKILK